MKIILPTMLALALAGCAVPASLASSAPREYVVCSAPADGCTDGGQMLPRPSTLLLSGDGSLSVRAISWRG